MELTMTLLSPETCHGSESLLQGTFSFSAVEEILRAQQMQGMDATQAKDMV